MKIHDPNLLLIQQALNHAAKTCFERSRDAGWWTDLKTGESLVGKRNHGEMMMLIVSEVSEGFEGIRKNLMDDKLPHRKMIEVELADVVIRVMDYCGAHGLDLGGAVAEKLQYNATREDHKLEARRGANGKKF